MIPDRPTVAKVRAAARACQACDLHKLGTQTVFGEGAQKAALMLVGEQPGDQEDLSGHPFVGPAGKLLDRVLEEAGIDRASVYVKYLREEQRSQRGCIARRMQSDFHHGLPRAPDDETRRRESKRLIDDLRKVARALS